MPGMAAKQPSHPEVHPLGGAVLADRYHHKLGAGRVKPAAAGQNRGQEDLVNPHGI